MKDKIFRYPNTSPPGRSDYIEYVMEPLDNKSFPRLFRVNLSWMTSNWQCSYGSCPGILVTGAHKDISCCEIGVKFGLWDSNEKKIAEWNRVRQSVNELTPEDWDHGYGKDKPVEYWTDHARTRRTKRTSKHKGYMYPANATQIVPEATKVVDGGCIFANRSGGAAGKPGCAFHHLAQRTGRHHSETKPDVCWMIPFFIGGGYDDEIQMEVTWITSTPASAWGPFDTKYTDTIGHWCTEIPDHFTGSEPVYRYAEVELRKMLKEGEYERMVEEIELAMKKRTARTPTPAEMVGNGRKLLPLLVLNRRRQWEKEGEIDKAATATAWLAEQEE